MQKVLHAKNYELMKNADGNTVGVTIYFEENELEEAQRAAQAHEVGRLTVELTPLEASFEGGVEGDELADVAMQLKFAKHIPAGVRKGLVNMAIGLKQDYADGNISRGEALARLMAFVLDSVKG